MTESTGPGGSGSWPSIPQPDSEADRQDAAPLPPAPAARPEADPEDRAEPDRSDSTTGDGGLSGDAAPPEPAVEAEPAPRSEREVLAAATERVGSDPAEPAGANREASDPVPVAPAAALPPLVEPAGPPSAEGPPGPEGAPTAGLPAAAEPVSQPAAAVEPADGSAAAAAPAERRSRLVPAAAAAVVLAVAGSVLLAVVAQRVAHHNAVNAARKAAIAAARTETAATLSYDYRHLDADFAAAERGLTPRFRASYARTTASSVVPLARKTHAVSTATVAAAGVISVGADSAKVLVYADQTVQNNLLKTTSRLDQSVIEVSMVKRGGRWLIDNLQPF